MTIKPANDTTKKHVSEILQKFMREAGQLSETHQELLSQLYIKYQIGEVRAPELPSMIVERPEVVMRDSNKFMILEPTEDMKVLPLITMHSSDNWRHFRIYALLATTDPNSGSALQTLAVRFETDESHHTQESNDGAHDFCHAQLCNWISKHVQNVFPVWVPDSQPSIPLDADSQVTLVLCMLTSLYGGKLVRKKFYPPDKALLEHLEKVRALKR